MGEGGENWRFECTFCHMEFRGSYYRVKAHLLKLSGHGIRVCSKVSAQSVLEMKRVVEECEKRVQDAMPKQVSLPKSTSSRATEAGGASSMSLRQEGLQLDPRKRKAGGTSAIEKAFNLETRDQLNSEIARMFYSAGLPFHLARNPHYVTSYTFAASNAMSGYIPPGYNMLRTTLLQKERANLERILEPIKGTWKEKGISIVADGWTDAQRRPLINFMAVTEDLPMFLKAVNCEGEYKDKYFIADLFAKVIEEVGAKNVVQVITDNAPVCKAAGSLVSAKYPSIYWTPCVVHTLNLALKNICAAKNTEANEVTYEECHWITEIGGDVIAIKNFVMNHSMRLAIFNEFVNLKMLSVADTRFASMIVMLKRFKQIKKGLQTMAISDKWSSYKEDVEKATFVREKVLDEIWWDKVDYILAFTEPIYDMLRKCDTDAPSLHLIYERWDSMIENVRTIVYRHEGKGEDDDSSFFSVLHTILVDRWDKSNTPLHCLAHSLNPKYYSSKWLEEHPGRVAPHKDVEISNERNKCFKRFFPDPNERRMINVEYAKFSGAMYEFFEHDSILDRGEMEPKLWWFAHGSPASLLQTLALKVLGQPSSSSCCERNWSTYSFIHSMRRNKMAPQRAEDLVYVHSNLRLLSRRSPQYTQGETKMWDIGGDAFDSLEGAGILEVAELSLDEPDLEGVIFTEEADDDLDFGSMN